ncbi:histidine-rich glycoprotein-like isoform X2 [Agrilus planipennis]|uniref:Histidine-rich glycoprotein-like isoform X1 n=1 Tax=Agrilus planipennis TaxID=224129 RepID=A0A1W4WUH9_AGRPL|nr:histidine-rich glycoprotein-like isoform X1 [Agrilus planipennis]XP_025837210.1 histidine-rich glycoprotein-like isoform X2 [Agrilus planipennis]
MRYKVVYVFLLALPCIAVAFSHQHATTPGYYQFSYGVNDPHTKDHKHQHEEKDGDVVKGSYSFDEPDGTKRVVDYVAGPHKGFQAVVKRIGTAYHPVINGKHNDNNNNKYYGNNPYLGYYGKYYPNNYDHYGKYDPKNYDSYGKYNPKTTYDKHNDGKYTGESHHPYHQGKYYDENHIGKDVSKNNDNHDKYYNDNHRGSSSYPGFYGHNKGVQGGYKVTRPGKNIKPSFDSDSAHPGHYYHPGYGKYIPYDPVYSDHHEGHYYGHGGSDHHNNDAHHPAHTPSSHDDHKGATSYVGITHWGY